MRPSVGRLRARGGRSLLAAVGILAAGLMAGVALTLVLDLRGGFDRAVAQSDLPNLIVTSDDTSRGNLGGRVRALPGVRDVSLRYEVRHVPLGAGSHHTFDGIITIVDPGRRGYRVVEGHDLGTRTRGLLVDRGVARAWHLHPGGSVVLGRSGSVPIVGIVASPDNVAFPLAKTARVYIPAALARDRTGRGLPANRALVWLAPGASLDVALTQARAEAAGLHGLRFATRSSIRTGIDQAAGIVIALLAAFATVTIAISGVVLVAGAQSEARRQAASIGTLRALGASRARITLGFATDGALLGAGAGSLGLFAGALLVRGRAESLLAQLNLEPAGASLSFALVAAAVTLTALVAAATAWPAWRLCAAPIASLMRGGDLVTQPRRRGVHAARGGGALVLGARMGTARRARYAATVVVLLSATAAIALLISLAQSLTALRDDPGSVGRLYQLTARVPPDRVDEVRAIPGVAAAAPRYETDAADSFQLGQTFRVIAYPGDHTAFEAPRLSSGRRVQADGEAEVGDGLADALGVRPGSTLALQLPSGGEARFRVVGTVAAIELSGRVVYVRPRRLLAADPGVSSRVAVRLRSAGDRARVTRRLAQLGTRARGAGGATTRNTGFVGLLAGVLQILAAIVAIASLQALVQSLSLLARERRGALALLRALGGGRRMLVTLLAGAGLAATLPASVAGLAADRWLLGPHAARAAAPYAPLALAPSHGVIAFAVGGMAVLAVGAAAIATRAALRTTIVRGLRSE